MNPARQLHATMSALRDARNRNSDADLFTLWTEALTLSPGVSPDVFFHRLSAAARLPDAVREALRQAELGDPVFSEHWPDTASAIFGNYAFRGPGEVCDQISEASLLALNMCSTLLSKHVAGAEPDAAALKAWRAEIKTLREGIEGSEGMDELTKQYIADRLKAVDIALKTYDSGGGLVARAEIESTIGAAYTRLPLEQSGGVIKALSGMVMKLSSGAQGLLNEGAKAAVKQVAVDVVDKLPG